MVGGESSRMGRDKAQLLDSRGEPLWKGRWELLKQLVSPGETVMISCRREQMEMLGCGARLVVDQWVGAGPLGGIVSSLEATEADRLLVLAVDLPGMTRDGLAALVEAAGSGGAVFRCAGFLEPLAAVYPKSMAASGRRRLEAGDFALRGWIAEAGALMREVEAPAEWAGLFLNVNDPAAWAAWLAES